MPICSSSSSLARRFTSGRARFNRVTISGTVSARRAYTRERESRAAMISNEGFSVVAPMRMMSPRST